MLNATKLNTPIKEWGGTSLVVQWLRLCAPHAGRMGSIPGWGTKIPHVMQHGQNEWMNKGKQLRVYKITKIDKRQDLQTSEVLKNKEKESDLQVPRRKKDDTHF